MPSDEGRRRQREAEEYRRNEQQKRDEAKRASQERLRGAHLAVQQTIKRRMEQHEKDRQDYERRLEQARKEVKEQFGGE
jgi:hypothetical protein